MRQVDQRLLFFVVFESIRYMVSLEVTIRTWAAYNLLWPFVFVFGWFGLPGTDFVLKKHSNQRGGLTDTVLRVRSTSIIKMVNTGHRQERRRVSRDLAALWREQMCWGWAAGWMDFWFGSQCFDEFTLSNLETVMCIYNIWLLFLMLWGQFPLQMKAAKRVNFMDIVKLETLTDEEHIVLVYLNSRVMRLSLKDSLPFLLAVQRNMKVRGTVLAAIYTCICP